MGSFSSTVHRAPTMSLVVNSSDFTHILRVLSTNVDGKQKVSFAMTAIKGVGRRFSDVRCKKADIDVQKRAGELTTDEIERLVTVILNRQKDHKDGKHSQVIANAMESKLREDLERMKKIRAHRGLRHFWGLRVRGQHTKTTGRRGRTVGVSKKRGG